jgi:hypothetical protein
MVAWGVMVASLLLGAAAPQVSHTLAWTYGSTARAWRVEQCTNKPHGCPMELVATVDGQVSTITVQGLKRMTSYCWRVQVSETGQYSNVVCSP